MTDWNDAIDAAVNAVHRAPVFPRNVNSPLVDAQIITILSIAADTVRKLRKPADGETANSTRKEP